MKILLLNPPYLPAFIRSGRWPAESISGSNWYPIWLGYCAGLLEKAGHSVRLLDALVDRLSAAETIDRAYQFKPELVVIYTCTESLNNDITIAGDIKKDTGADIVFVGPWCSLMPEEILKASDIIDAVAVGEFDYTILELASGKEPGGIHGLCWKKDGEIFINPPREPIGEGTLDNFPFVTDVYKRHLNIKNYFQAPLLYPFVDLFTGRGCAWGRCSFCLWPYTISKGASYRKRGIENVMDELRFIKKELPFVKEVFFQDDTLPADRAREISEAILKEGLKVIWSCYARVDLDFGTLEAMKKAGCRMMHVGYESPEPEILRLANKGTSREMAEEFTHNANKAGILIHADFLIGLPGETEESIRRTIKWAKRLPVHSYQFTPPRIYPKTPLYYWALKNNCLKDGRINLPGLDYEELSRWCERAITSCHFAPSYIIRMLRMPGEFVRAARGAVYVIRNLYIRGHRRRPG